MTNNSMYHPGYADARRFVSTASKEELLGQIDSLFGRDNLPCDYSLSELRTEAFEQVKKDFLTDWGKDQQEHISVVVKAVKNA